jgi:predicted transcriptional regulator
MADGGATIQIDETLKKRLEAAAETAGQPLHAYVHDVLETLVAEYEADWDEVDRICDETIAKGDGIPFEELRPWLSGWGKPDRPPRPR